jgi:hypothetical protein
MAAGSEDEENDGSLFHEALIVSLKTMQLSRRNKYAHVAIF